MKGLYLMLAAVFIMLMISPAAYSTEPSNMSMGYLKEMESNVTVYVDANTSTSDEKIGVWDIPVSEVTGAECSYGEPTAPTTVKTYKMSMGSLYQGNPNVTLICEAANLSDLTPPLHERINASAPTGAECSYGGRSAPTTKKPKYPYILMFEGGGSFTPTERLDDRIQDKLTSAGEDDYIYCFVMVSEGTTDANRNVLTEHGVKLLGYHFHHSHKAKIPLNRIEEIGNLSFVRWIGYAPFDLKIHPTLQKMISSGSDDEIRVYINVFDSDINEKSEKIVCNDGKTYCKCIPHGPFQNKLEEMGVTILDYEEGRGRKTFIAHATPETINRIAGLDFVLFIKTGALTNMSGKLLDTQRSPNTDEPSEQEMTTGDSNHGIVTIVRTAFAYIQRRLI